MKLLKSLWLKILCLTGLMLALTGCGGDKKNSLKVAATAVPHADMLNAIKPQLAKKGINLEVVVVDDYRIPNRALEEKEVDANFFQHIPFLDAENENFNYHLESFQKVHIEPLGLYSKNIKDINDLPKNFLVAVPSDPTNQSRALILLQQLGWITLKPQSKSSNCSLLDILEKKNNVEIVEVDAALLARALEDVDFAAIPTNFALQAKIMEKPLFIEKSDSPFANILAIRQGEEDRPDLVALKEALTSPEMEQYILSHYQGVIVPAFDSSTTKLSSPME